MSSLFGESFQERVELQRRQLFHQELLESARMQTRECLAAFSDTPPSFIDGGERGAAFGLWAKAGAFLALVCFVYTIPAAVASAVAALPVAAAWKLISPGLGSYGEFYRATAVEIFAYLCVTAVAIVVVYGLLEPSERIELVRQVMFFPDRLTGESAGMMFAILLPGVLVLWAARRSMR